MTKRISIISCAALALALSACGGGFQRTLPGYPYRPTAGADPDVQALSRAINRFYGAADMDEAAEAVEAAEQIAPEAPATHEIAGRLARYAGDEEAAWRHYYLALASPDNPQAYLHLLNLLELQSATWQYRESLALLQDIVAKHPDRSLRRVASAFLASWHRRLDGSPELAAADLDKRGLLDSFAVISPFENDDGKGFTVEHPPEREANYDQEYPGTQFPARWRVDVPLNHQRNLDLGALVSPSRWVTAYANSYVKVPTEDTYLVRVTTTDPLKLWVNEIEVLSEEKVEGDTVDQFVFPVTLRQGWNRLLLKSCHGSGAWRVGVGITDRDGGLVKGLENTAEPQEVQDGAAPGDGYDFKQDLERRLGAVEEPLRRAHFAIELAQAFGLTTAAQDLVDDYLSLAPNSVMARFMSAVVAWYAGRPGGTIDMLDALIEENGSKAPRVYLFRASFFTEQDRLDRARQDLQAAVDANPDYRSARLRLANNFAAEGWDEDCLQARLRDAERWPDDTPILWGLARAYKALGRQPEAEKVYRSILERWRGAEDILEEMVELALRRNRYRKALRYQRDICEIYPNSPACYYELGNLLRRAGRVDEAQEAYLASRAIDDRWAPPIIHMGSMAYELGNREEALELWNMGLEYDPDNHSLADRIDFLAPSDGGLLGEYVPTKDQIRAVLAGMRDVRLHPGSNLVFLLDHAVERVEKDGSSRQVVTQVITVVNDTGRDQLTQYSFPAGRLKVLEAYAIDPDGTRREASSLRGSQVRFRELKIGSTVVLQYRLDTHPYGYLARYLYRRWFFHGVGTQFELSQFDLLLPEDLQIAEWGHGDWKKKERTRQGRRVLSYYATHVPPLVGEPSAPPVLNLLDQVVLTSIPDWDTIAEWDAALMVDAFRPTPETKELARKLTADAGTPRAKLDAITRFVMREIRYQQDYEDTIAGVKPHTAATVLQRGYGDCKDKSVLLMTLAREVGIKTHFAILRTTGMGDLVRDVPFLQFNHAIVYVPQQDGIDAPLFVDATPDTLDIATLRPDDQGTWAMAIDPDTRDWEFIEIPFRPASEHYTIRTTRIEPVLDGPSKIQLDFVFQGPTAATLRQVLRNPDDTQIFLSQMVGQLFPGARLEDVSFDGQDDIVKPLSLSLTVLSEQIVREQGDSIVVDVPKVETLSSYASLTERRLPLQAGLYLSLVENTDEVQIPEGYRVKHQPAEVRVDNRFFTFERSAELVGDRLRTNLRFTEKATRIAPEDYPEFREAVSEVVDNLKQDLIFEPTGKRKGKQRKNKGQAK